MTFGDLESFILHNDIHFYDENQPFEQVMKERLNSYNEASKSPSFFLNDIGELMNNIDHLRKNIPNASLYYRVSANPDKIFIRTLNKYGVRFSVSSGPEIENLLSLGVSSSSILYSGICKLNSHIRFATSNNVNLLTFGTSSELRNIVRYHPKCDLMLRIQPPVAVGPDTSYQSVNASASTEECVFKLLSKANELNMNVVGLEVNLVEDASEGAYNQVHDLLKKSVIFLLNFGYTLSKVYFNGGMPSPSTNSSRRSMYETALSIINEISEVYPRTEIMVEPTEYIVDSAAQLFCTIIGINPLLSSKEQCGSIYYYLNDGVYGSLGCVLYKSYMDEPDYVKNNPLDADSSSEYSEKYDSTFWGPTCDSMDNVCTTNKAPLLNVGDILRFKRLGTHAIASATTFNGFSLADVHHMISYQKLESLGISRELAERALFDRYSLYLPSHSH